MQKNENFAKQAEQAEAERPEVVAWQYRVTAGPQTGWSLWHPGKGEEFERSYTVERRPLMTVAQHDRIVGELRAERDGAIKLLGQSVWQKIERLTQERDAALARVAELEKQEPVATIAKVPGEDWNGLHFYRDLQGMQPGTKLYAAPVAQAQPEETPGEILAAKLIETWVTKHGKPAPWSTAVEITAVATNMPNDERDRLLALDDDVDAQAQHSVPEGWMLVECGIWTQEQVDEMQKTVARFRNSEFVDDRALAMAVADAGQCKAPEISLAELLAAAPGKEGL